MKPVIVPPEKVAEFNALKAEFNELTSKIGKLDDSLKAGFRDDLFDQLREHMHRQWEIMAQMQNLGQQS
jgi:hypothetical protein